MFDLDNDSFPRVTDDVSKIFMHEAPFQRHLLDQGFWFWRNFGIKTPWLNPACRCPDLISFVNDGRTKGKIRFSIEVEYAAKNFILHGHDPSLVHLILAFHGTLGYYSIKGVPVVAYYRKCPDGLFRFSLEDDVRVIFQGKESRLLREFGGGTGED